MKKIDLTEDQIQKLLDMCQDLFPEYNEVKLDVYLKLDVVFSDSGSDVFYINWFELCMLHLPKKIADNFETVDTTDKHRQIFDILSKRVSGIYPFYNNDDLNHPVDYLYSVYKKTLK